MKNPEPNHVIKVAIADDHALFRTGVKTSLQSRKDIQMVAEAENGMQLLNLLRHIQPDVVLLDIQMPVMDGLTALPEIKKLYPNVKVIMLTSYAEDEMLFSAIRAGASGYVLKQIGSDDLVKAIEAVARGEALLDPAVTQRVFQEVRRAVKEEAASAFVHLSQQEKHVLLLVSEGKTNREIAKQLFLGEGTVRNYVSSILAKLNVNNRAEAAAYAVQHSLRGYITT